MDRDPLATDPETMRRLGYQAIDWLVERAHGRADEPVLVRATPEEMAGRVAAEPPAHGTALADVLAHLGEEVLPYRSRIDHPRYLAYIPGEGTWPGALADLVASAYNIDAGNWMESAGPSQLEVTVLRWFADWIGYPARAAGVLVSGGSAANLTAMACAREALVGAMRDDVVAYVSEQAHSSLARAARVLGFRPQQLRVLPVDAGFRLRVDSLRAAIEADRRAGLRPLLVLAVAGTTNTGAVDDLHGIADVCREHGVWMHVDGAYGAFAALTARGREALAGLERADSVTLDPHKWLYQPIECGALLVREGRLLKEAFEIHPSYLQDTASRAGEVNFADAGLQLTRTSRALKLWVSVQTFGVDAFAGAIERSMEIARHAQQVVECSAELELMAPATLGIVCFRRHPPGRDTEDDLEGLNSHLVEALAASGEGLLSSTRLTGRYAVRLCVLNHSTSRADVERVLSWVATAPLPERTVAAPPVEPGRATTGELADGWPGAGAAVEELRRLPLFAGVDPGDLRWAACVARRRTLPPGETVVRQWDVDRDFYVVLDGEAEVLSHDRGHDRLLTTLTTGDFFGELAALDWGASFGYPRLATVRATTELVVLALTETELAELMSRAPLVDARVRAAAAERATRM